MRARGNANRTESMKRLGFKTMGTPLGGKKVAGWVRTSNNLRPIEVSHKAWLTPADVIVKCAKLFQAALAAAIAATELVLRRRYYDPVVPALRAAGHPVVIVACRTRTEA